MKNASKDALSRGTLSLSKMSVSLCVESSGAGSATRLNVATLWRCAWEGGVGFRGTGRVLGFSPVSVYYWIKAYAQRASEQELGQRLRPRVIELDEMHGYVGEKKPVWLWVGMLATRSDS